MSIEICFSDDDSEEKDNKMNHKKEDDTINEKDDFSTSLMSQVYSLEVIEEEKIFDIRKELVNWEEFFMKGDVFDELEEISETIHFKDLSSQVMYPPKDLVFKAFELTPINKIKVVIVGMDPYHNKGSATGLCFSINSGQKINPSMRNIQKVVEKDGFKVDVKKGNLINWANQGVFLINAALTVDEGEAESHLTLWENFTKILFRYISEKDNKIIWMLWGKKAQNFNSFIKSTNVIKCSHPSPLGATKGSGSIPSFMESKCFKRCNEILKSSNKDPIDWSIL